MRFTKILSLLLLAVFSLAGSAAGLQAAELTKVPTAWIDRHETFLIWYAKEKGWDREEGLNIDILYFPSGKAILEGLESGAWVFAGMGDVSALRGNHHYNTTIIGVANDEASTSAVLVHKNSPILKVKGWNKDYPEVYGSPETVRGKTFLVTPTTSSQYALSSWLKVLGLTDQDVIIREMDQAQSLASFDNNLGDGVALWSPYVFRGLAKDWKVAADLTRCKMANPIMLVADTAYAEAHPDITAKFLKLCLRTVDALQNGPMDELVSEYQRFYLEWAGKNYPKELCLADLKAHTVYNLDEQLALFDNCRGSSVIEKWQSDIVSFLNRPGSTSTIAPAAIQGNATDKYLKLLAPAASAPAAAPEQAPEQTPEQTPAS